MKYEDFPGGCRCSVTKLCPTLCNPMDCSMLGFLVLHYLPEFAQTHVRWINDAIQPSLSLLLLLLSIFPSIRVFSSESAQESSGGQRIGVSALASALPMNIQGWFPLGLTGWISLLSEGLSRVFSSTTNKKASIHQCSAFFMVQLSHPYMTC